MHYEADGTRAERVPGEVRDGRLHFTADVTGRAGLHERGVSGFNARSAKVLTQRGRKDFATFASKTTVPQKILSILFYYGKHGNLRKKAERSLNRPKNAADYTLSRPMEMGVDEES